MGTAGALDRYGDLCRGRGQAWRVAGETVCREDGVWGGWRAGRMMCRRTVSGEDAVQGRMQGGWCAGEVAGMTASMEDGV